MSENLSSDEIKDRLRTGWTLDPMTPGLKMAARDLFRPIIESTKGHEIIYRCRVPWLMRVDHLQVNNDGFRAVATPIQEIRDGFMSLQYSKLLEFGARWHFLRMSGLAICMAMITDRFYAAPAVVAEVKAAAARKVPPSGIAAIFERASNKR